MGKTHKTKREKNREKGKRFSGQNENICLSLISNEPLRGKTVNNYTDICPWACPLMFD